MYHFFRQRSRTDVSSSHYSCITKAALIEHKSQIGMGATSRNIECMISMDESKEVIPPYVSQQRGSSFILNRRHSAIDLALQSLYNSRPRHLKSTLTITSRNSHKFYLSMSALNGVQISLTIRAPLLPNSKRLYNAQLWARIVHVGILSWRCR